MPGTVEGRQRRAGDRTVRIAAVGDFHCGAEDAGAFRDLFAPVNQDADVLVLAGDLTRRGLSAEFRVVVAELADIEIPIVAVLGNHDYESGLVAEGQAILRARGIHLLDGDTFELNDSVGFVGAKGFMGGFGRATLTAFGEAETKAFVGAALQEVKRLEEGLRRLATPTRVVVLHYAPIVDTILGEPDVIQCFLGTDRLAEPLERYQASVVFHGHAHSGSFSGHTVTGIPVFNVSLPVLRRDDARRMYYVHEVETRPGLVAAG